MSAKEGHNLVEQQRAMVAAEQAGVLRRFQDGGVVRLFIKTAREVARRRHSDVKVKLSKPTDNPYDIPTISLVCDERVRLSAYEVIIAPGGVKGFRIRLGHDHWDRNCGAALIPDENDYFNGKYGDSDSLRITRRILMDGANPHKYGGFAGGATDITPPSRADRFLKQVILRKSGPHPEAPSDVIFHYHNPRRTKAA